MKRKLRFTIGIWMVIICIWCMAGCGKEKQPEEPVVPDEVVKTWEELEETAVQEFQTTEIPGVYYMDKIEIPEDYFCLSTALHERFLAMITGKYTDDEAVEVFLKVFDMAKNEMCLEKTLPEDANVLGFFSDGTFYISYYDTEEIKVYDLSGAELTAYETKGGTGAFYVDDRDRLWYFTDKGLWCLEDGEKTAYDVPFADYGAVISNVKNEEITYSCYGNVMETLTYNLITKEMDRLELYDGMESGKHVSYQGQEDGTFQYALEPDVVYRTNFEDTEYVHSVELYGDMLHIKKDSGIIVYDIVQKKAGKITLPNMIFNNYSIDEEGFVFTGNVGEKEQVYYVKGYEVPFSSVEVQEIRLTEAQQENLDVAERLYDEYGLSVQGLPMKAETEINYDYKNAYDVTDEQMSNFLMELEVVLEEYPDDFFKVMTKENVDDVRLMLCNGLHGIGENTLGEAGGLSYASGETLYIAVNKDEIYNLKRIFAHELMHTIDSAIALDYPEEEPFPEWETLNPTDFAYGGSYSNYYELTDKYVFDYTEENLDKAWFAIGYSKISELEDRATLFEDMVEPYELLYKAPHIHQKAEYLVGSLRNYYPEWYEDGEPLWTRYKG